MGGEVYHIVDHMKLDYKGIFDVNSMFRMFTKWYRDMPYEKGGDYISEYNTSHGKCMEYCYFPWLKDTDYIRKYMKIRILMYDVKKADIMVDGQKRRMDQGTFQLVLDGFIEFDYEHRWGGTPMLQFLRTVYFKYFYKRYTRQSEKVIIDECHQLYELFERFFNMYKSYKEVKEMPHWFFEK